MAIDLPPTLPPALVPAASIQAAAKSGANGKFKRFSLYLNDQADCLGSEMLPPAIDGAETLSDVVRELARSCYREGYPTGQIVYARVGDTVFISAENRQLAAVKLPEAYQDFFDGLEGTVPRDSDFEQRRALASVRADRDGENYRLKFEDAGNGDSSVVLAGDYVGEASTSKLVLQVGNLGNRFVGRHIAGLDIEESFNGGWTFGAEARTALSGLNDDEFSTTDSLNEQWIGLSKATNVGIFAISGRFLQFQDLEDALVPFDANLEQGGFSWAYTPYADFKRRLVTTLEAEYIDRDTELRPSGVVAFRERYTAIAAAANYTLQFGSGTRPMHLDATLLLSHGLGGNEDRTFASLDYLLIRPSAKLKIGLNESLNFNAGFSMQITDDVTPEQKQWVLGGIESVHAFLPGVASGDEGYVANLGVSTKDYQWNSIKYSLAGFAEMADVSSNLPGGGDVTLADVGLSLTWQYKKRTRGFIAYAVAVDDDDLSDAARDAAEADLLFSIAVDLGDGL